MPQLELAPGTFGRCLVLVRSLSDWRASRWKRISSRSSATSSFSMIFPDDYLEPLASMASVQDYQAGAIRIS